MMKVLSIVAAAVLMTATGALAAGPEGEAPVKEKKVCKSEKVTGSLTKVRRTCMTQAEWNKQAELARQGTDDMVRQTQNMSNAPGQSAN